MPANLPPTDDFAHRHLGPSPHDIERMLQTMGVASLDALIAEVVPSQIRTKSSLGVGSSPSFVTTYCDAGGVVGCAAGGGWICNAFAGALLAGAAA